MGDEEEAVKLLAAGRGSPSKMVVLELQDPSRAGRENGSSDPLSLSRTGEKGLSRTGEEEDDGTDSVSWKERGGTEREETWRELATQPDTRSRTPETQDNDTITKVPGVRRVSGEEGDGEEEETDNRVCETVQLFRQNTDLFSGEESESDTTALVEQQDNQGEEGQRKRESGILGASLNFTNSIIGAGVIGIPAAIRLAGFVPGILLLLFVAVVTDYTVILLIRNGIISGKFSYQEMVTEAFGKVGFWLLTIFQFCFPFLAMTGYVVIVGDAFSRIIEQVFVLADSEPPDVAINTALIKVVAVATVMFPISLLRNISMLEKFSALAILCILFIVLFTIARAWTYSCLIRCLQPSCCDELWKVWGINSNFIESVGIMAFAFVCHHNTYLIYSSLKQRSLTRFTRVSHISVSASSVFCVTLGVAGFVTFMGETKGDLLNSYCVDDHIATVARFFFACIIMLTYPIEMFVCREVLEIALSRLPYKSISWIPYQPMRQVLSRFLYSPRHSSLCRHVILTVGVATGSLAIGLTTDDLTIVLGFNGCLMATPLAFILPTASFLRLSRRGPWYLPLRLVAWTVLIIGVIVMVTGTGLAISQAVSSYRDHQSVHLSYCHSSYPDSAHWCHRLGNKTANFTDSVPFCDCASLCSNLSLLDLHYPSHNYSYSSFIF